MFLFYNLQNKNLDKNSIFIKDLFPHNMLAPTLIERNNFIESEFRTATIL
jgi:hypothetical protein